MCLIGHSHVALAFRREPGDMASGQTQDADDQLELSRSEWLVNPGSVGQPRDGDPRAAWLELDLDAWEATYRRTDYDIAGAAARNLNTSYIWQASPMFRPPPCAP